MAKLESTAGQERTAGQVVWTLDSTACHQPGKVELRMHTEQGQEDRESRENGKVGRKEVAAQQQTPGEITSSPHRFVIVS